jgi:hypothetical protein
VGRVFCSVARPHLGDDIRILSSPPHWKTRSRCRRGTRFLFGRTPPFRG